MPHDKNGQEIKMGDKITWTGRVTTVYPGAGTCNIVAESVEQVPDGISKTQTLTAAQVELERELETVGGAADE